MTKRWKFQIKTGLIWSVIYTSLFTLFQLKSISLEEMIDRGQIWPQLTISVISGIFIFGYALWKTKQANAK